MNDIISLSPVNQTYITKKQEAPQETKAVTSPIHNKKVLMIGAAALGAVALGGLIAAGRYKQAQKLAEHIDFTPAKTLEEAKEFAAKHLKIKHFDLTDLDSANYVNEALTNYNNNISVDHRKIIANVFSYNEETALAAIDRTNNSLYFNEKKFINAGEDMLKILKIDPVKVSKNVLCFLDDRQKELFIKFFDDSKRAAMSKKDTVEFKDILENIRLLSKSTYGWFSNLTSDPKAVEILKAKNLPTTAEELLKLSKEQQKEIIEDLVNNHGIRLHINNGGAFRTINHEIGHAVHYQNVGEEQFKNLRYFGGREKDYLKASQRLKAELGDSLYGSIQSNVSMYATTSPTEFVAETYSYLCNGQKFSNEIMDLYKKYGGVIPKCAQ